LLGIIDIKPWCPASKIAKQEGHEASVKFTQECLEQADVKIVFVVQVTGTIVWRMLQIYSLVFVNLLEHLAKNTIGEKWQVDQGIERAIK
jgi:hypothetical protein